MIKVSVIVPVYNVEKYIEKCLTSLVNQTLKDIEIIVVNDGSPDKSQDIIDKFKNQYKNITSYIKENGGLSDARNYGISKAKGKYIAFVDSDDFVSTTMYDDMYNKIINNDYDMVVSDYYIIDNNLTKQYSSHIKEDLNSKQEIKKIFNTIYPAAWNKLYKKELFDNLLFKKGIWFEDVEFLYRLLPNINKIGVVKKPLYYYIKREGSITSRTSMKVYDYVDNFNGLIDYYKKNNLYSKYHKELEYSYVRYIYATFIKSCLGFSYNEYLKALNVAIKNVKTNFPNYKKNKYFYKSLKGFYLVLFNRNMGKLLYKVK